MLLYESWLPGAERHRIDMHLDHYFMEVVQRLRTILPPGAMAHISVDVLQTITC